MCRGRRTECFQGVSWSGFMTVDASEASRKWHERRIGTVSAPYGPLSLVGTHWVEGFPDGRIPAIRGWWAVDGDAVVLTAVAPDGLTLDGEPFAGEVRPAAGQGPAGAARVGLGERRLVVLVREGGWGVRDFGPASETRTASKGVEVTAYDPRRSVPGQFTPYEGRHAVGRLRRLDQRRRQLSPPVSVPCRSGRGGARDGGLQPVPASTVCVRRPLRLPLSPVGEYAGRRDSRRRTRSPLERCRYAAGALPERHQNT